MPCHRPLPTRFKATEEAENSGLDASSKKPADRDVTRESVSRISIQMCHCTATAMLLLLLFAAANANAADDDADK